MLVYFLLEKDNITPHITFTCKKKSIFMISSKFGIGQQVRHSLLGYLGVIVDVDPEYSLNDKEKHEIDKNKELKSSPWYHVIMEDEKGQTIHTYLAESQLSWETPKEHPEQSSLDALSDSIKRQLKTNRLRH